MMKILLYVMILAIICGIVGIVFIIKSIRKNIEEEYRGANIISFLFPGVGLIIYAVNVGKNDKLAKSCVKMVLYGIGFGLALSITVYCICMIFLYGVYNTNVSKEKGNKISNIEQVEESLSTEDIKNILNDNSKITNVKIRTTGKIVYLDISFIENITEGEAKKIANNIFTYNIDMSYDYSIHLIIGNQDFFGYHEGIRNNSIIWSYENN